ncbi:MAG: cyclophilin-like fold protein, partial [Sulfolobales archaeon]
MLIEVVCDNNSLVLNVPDDVSEVLPFTSKLIRWKEEVYFSTPYTARLDGLKAYTHVSPGNVYYWPPERAFCIFYGFSEPYSEVYLLGEYIGPLTLVRKIDVGDIRVTAHTTSEELAGLVSLLGKLGYSTATPLDGGSRVVVASKHLYGVRIGLTLIKEDFGVYVESDSFYLHNNSYNDLRTTYRLKSKLKSLTTTIRFDLNEEGYTCLTAVAKDIS